jgi:predicted DNA-binding transcriptional regulator YafY
MSGPTARVLAVLELLQTHGRMAGSELARRLEVDTRTIRRYIVVLEDLGIPVTAERGRDGHYMLVSGFKLPPMMFTDDEALALSVGLRAARHLGLAEAQVAVAGALAKLERVMPARLTRRVRAVSESVTLGLARAIAPEDNAALGALSEAAQTETRVRMRYRSRQGDLTERDFDPYGLAYQGSRWYAVGMCHLRGGLRSFRLDRVEAVRHLPSSFSRPAGFDALSHLLQSVASLPRAFTTEVLLETDLDAARRQMFPAIGILERVGNGVLLRSQVDDLHWFARELARLPFPFEVRQPDELRVALKEVAQRLVKQACIATSAVSAAPGLSPRGPRERP